MRGLLLCLVLFTPLSSLSDLRAAAQSYLYNVGNQSWGTNLPIENGFINVNNGEIHLEFPLATHPQRGGQFQLDEKLVYDSRIWQIVNTGSSYTFQPTNVSGSQGGWRFIAGNEAGGFYISSSSQPFYCYVGGYSFVYAQDTDYFFSYRDPSGTWHYFQGMTQQPPQTPPNPEGGPCQGATLPTIPNTPNATGSAIDGSGYTVVVSNYTSATVYDSAGKQVYPSIVDRNGNYYSADSNGNLVDTLGRTPVLKTVNGNQTYYDVLASGGTRSRYTVTTISLSVSTDFLEPAVKEYTGTITVVSSIGLPDGSSYQFRYDPFYGELIGVTLPTSGTITYGYTNYFDSFHNVNRWLNTRVKDGGTTTYTPKVLTYCSGSSGCQEQVTVTSPAANDTLYTFTLDSSAITQGESWNTNVSAYQGSAANGALLQSATSAYTYQTLYAPTASPNPTPQYLSANVPATLVQTHTLNDVNVTSKTVTSFNVLWNDPTSVQVWDYYGGTAPTSPTQTTAYNYLNYGFFELPAQASATDAAGNLISQTTYAYDETTGSGHASLVPVSGLPQQPITQGPNRGNATTVTQWAASGTTLSTTASYDAAGMIRTVTDPNGTTRFSYDGSGAYVSTLTPPTPASGVSLASSTSLDGSTGLLSTSTDANGTKLNLIGYDGLNRPAEQNSLDANGNMVARTTYTYSLAALVTHTYQNASVYTDSETLYDSYGRGSRTAVSNGQSTNAWYQQDACYDTSGNRSFLSYPYSGSGFGQAQVCSGAGDSYTYDAFGRIKSVTHADGSKATYNYAGRATQYTDENGVSRITQTDGLGRISAVCELSSTMPHSNAATACGLDIQGIGYKTTYAYDLARHMTTITQGSQISRVFTTDAVGRQTSVLESEAPSAATTFSYTYNSTGLAVSRIRPRANIYNQNPLQLTTTTSQYDNAGRLLSVSYNDGITPAKSFSYDQPGNGGSIPSAGASKGRLTGASNGVHGRSYAYDALGRIVQTVECLPDWCGLPQHDVFRFYTYDWTGNLISDRYATSGNGQSYAPPVGYSYNRAGQLTSVTGGQSNAASPSIYSADTLLPYGPQHVSYGNGVSATSQYDSLGRLQGRWLCNGPGGVNCPNGGYIYGLFLQRNGSRVQWAVDTEVNRYTNYTYDAMGRLIGSAPPPANSGYTGLNYSATYDQYGNRWSQTVSNTPSGYGPNQSLSFNMGNNQILGIPYDQAGNLIGDFSGHTYQYDAENNLISIDNGNTATFGYSALGERDKVSVGGVTDRYGVDLAGRRSTTWLDGTTTLKLAQYYNDAGPVAFWTAADGNIHFEHQDWEGTERVRTGPTGTQDATFTSLPYGEPSTGGTDLAPGHYAFLDQDVSTNFGISHAGAREYSTILGRWMSPDPYQGSYDFTSPQSFNRYSYVMNDPLSAVDPSGLDGEVGTGVNLGFGCIGAVAEGGQNPAADIGCALNAIRDLFDLFGGPSFHGTTRPRPSATASTGTPNWDDPLSEHIGFPKGTPLPSGGLGDVLGFPQQPCEFGACGGSIGDSFQQGAATAPISWCAEHPTICTVGADAAAFARAIPAVAASVLLLNMEGDNKADPNRCVAVRQRAIAACTDIHIGTGGRRDNSGAFFACVRKKMEAEGCQY